MENLGVEGGYITFHSEIVCKGVDWIHLDQGKVQRQALVWKVIRSQGEEFLG